MMLIRVLFLVLALAAPATAQTVRSLDQVPSALKTPEAKAVFAEQMEGRPPPDGLGVRLPAGLSEAQVAALLIPAGDDDAVILVGARALPGQAGAYVAIACTGAAPPKPADDPRCEEAGYGASRSPIRVYVGLIQAGPGAAPRLLAKPLRVDGAVRWTDTILGDAPIDADDVDGGRLEPQAIARFDLAPYVIAPGQRAFGLIGTWSEGYSGGGAAFGALYLLAVVDGAVRQVLSTPMWFSKNIAGDWHEDGTRDHDLTEEAAVLMVTSRSTQGYFDLRQRARLSKESRLFRWSDANKRYEPAGR